MGLSGGKEKLRVNTYVGSLGDPRDVENAARLIAEGEPVAVDAGAVFGIFVDASQKPAITRALAIKGEVDGPDNKPLAVMMDSAKFAQDVDLEKVDPRLRKLFEEDTGLLAGIAHIRAPITQEATAIYPPSIQSKEGDAVFVHALDVGDRPVKRLFQEAQRRGVGYIGATTLNSTGDPEIVDIQAAEEFTIMHPAIGAFLTDDYES